jgi:hypothetical protein
MLYINARPVLGYAESWNPSSYNVLLAVVDSLGTEERLAEFDVSVFVGKYYESDVAVI